RQEWRGLDEVTPLLEIIDEDLNPEGDGPTIFEFQLEHAGLLKALERNGILPVVNIPNPFLPGNNIEGWTQWWAEHPQEREKYDADVQARRQILRYLYLGIRIGELRGTEILHPYTFRKSEASR